MTELERAVRIVVGAFESTDLGYVVVGSTAAASWGVARTTRDVDIVAVLSERDLVDALESIRQAGMYVPEFAAREAATRGGSFSVLDPVDGGKVDLFVVDSGDGFTRSRIERRVRSTVLGVECWVATPEDVVLAKLRWRRTSRSEVLWRDCVEIAASNDLDADYLRDWGDDLGIADDLEELLSVTERPAI